MLLSPDRQIEIAGIKCPSLVDYPQKVAFTIWTQGCNLACDYCFNPEFIPIKRGCLTWESCLSQIKQASKVIEAVVFTGGEPTIHKGLLDCIGEVKELNLLVGLHSNGMGEYFKQAALLVDFILLSKPVNGNIVTNANVERIEIL